MKDQHLEWEEVVCAWCGSSDCEPIFEGPDRLHSLPGSFFVVRCTQCGLIRQSPRLTWDYLKGYYPEEYEAYDLAETQSSRIGNKLRSYGNWKKRRAVEHFQPSGRLLDIGCGTGGFLTEMAKGRGWTILGIEPNDHAAGIARSRLGAQIITGKFTDVGLEPETFDVITLWCVLEHLEQPIDDLRSASRLLKKGGWLVFSIPNCESIEAKIFAQYWAGWDLPRHLYLFPRPTLYRILNSLNLDLIDTRCLSTSYAILGHNLEFWSQSWEVDHPNLKRALIKSYDSWIGRLISLAPLKVLDMLRLSTTLTIFAKKI